jgi:FdrA protein
MDIVLGYGAHPDPANEIGHAIEKAKAIANQDERTLIVLLSITGTDGDPQDLNRQQDVFERAGAIVCDSNAAASWLAVMIVEKLTSD